MQALFTNQDWKLLNFLGLYIKGLVILLVYSVNYLIFELLKLCAQVIKVAIKSIWECG